MKHIVVFLIIPLIFVLGCSAKNQDDQIMTETSTNTENLVNDFVESHSSPPDSETEIIEESDSEERTQTPRSQQIILAQAPNPNLTSNNWSFEEGKHYMRMVPTQPTVGGNDKIEVAEFFWYGCNHCFDFEPTINEWARNAPKNVRFVRIPALWNPLVRLHGRLYYTEEILSKNGKLKDPDGFRTRIFLEYHQRRNRMASDSDIQNLFEEFGVSAEDFQNTWKSFEVAQKLRLADDLARRYSINSVPAIVVNGKYRTGAAEAGSYKQLINVIDELIQKESMR